MATQLKSNSKDIFPIVESGDSHKTIILTSITLDFNNVSDISENHYISNKDAELLFSATNGDIIFINGGHDYKNFQVLIKNVNDENKGLMLAVSRYNDAIIDGYLYNLVFSNTGKPFLSITKTNLLASDTKNGIMSSVDKQKIDNAINNDIIHFGGTIWFEKDDESAELVNINSLNNSSNITIVNSNTLINSDYYINELYLSSDYKVFNGQDNIESEFLVEFIGDNGITKRKYFTQQEINGEPNILDEITDYNTVFDTSYISIIKASVSFNKVLGRDPDDNSVTEFDNLLYKEAYHIIINNKNKFLIDKLQDQINTLNGNIKSSKIIELSSSLFPVSKEETIPVDSNVQSNYGEITIGDIIQFYDGDKVQIQGYETDLDGTAIGHWGIAFKAGSMYNVYTKDSMQELFISPIN